VPIQLQTTSRGELTANGTSVSAPLPAGTVAGDVLVAELSAQHNVPTPDQAGWVTIAGSALSTISANLYLRVATASEPTTITFTGLPSSGHSLQVSRWTGVDTANPIDVPGVGFNQGTTTNFIDAPSLNIVTPGAVVVTGLGIQSGGSTRFFTPPSGVTLVVEDDPASAFSRRGFIYQEPRAAAGATGTRRFAMSASLPQAGTVFALRPATSTGPVAPTVSAGADASILLGNPFERTATATGSPTSWEWTVVEGPGGIRPIGTSATLSWTPTEVGSYILEATATNAAGSGFDLVTVTVTEPPVIDGTPEVAWTGFSAKPSGSAQTHSLPGVQVTTAGQYVAVGVVYSNDNLQTTSGVTLGGIALAQLVSAVEQDDSTTQIWGVYNPPIGTYSATATLSAPTTLADQMLGVGAWVVSNADPAAPLRGVAPANAEATTITATAATQSGDLVVGLGHMEAVIASGATYGMTGPAGLVQDWNVVPADASIGAHVTATGTQTSFTWTSSIVEKLSGTMAVFAAAEGGGGTAPVPALQSRVVDLPTDTEGAVRVRTSDANSVRLVVGINAAVTTGVVTGSAVTPDADGRATVTATGLAPHTRYYYRIQMTDSAGGTHLDTGTVGEFVTAPAPMAPTSFGFDFSSCCDAADSTAMAAIAARKDDLTIHLGDLYYHDGTGTTLSNFEARMDAKITAPHHAAALAVAPFLYTGSDHDGMTNNSYWGVNNTAWTNWNTAFRSRFTSRGIPATRGVYRTFAWGRIRFIILDDRSFRTTTTALGATQKQWLKDTITAAPEPVIVIASSPPWTDTADTSGDGWDGVPAERLELADFFAASGKRIAMLGGDQHALSINNGTSSDGGIHVFQASPLNNSSSHKGVYTTGPYPTTTGVQVQQYGRIWVDDTGSDITLTFTGYSADNTARMTGTMVYDEPVVPEVHTTTGTATTRATATASSSKRANSTGTARALASASGTSTKLAAIAATASATARALASTAKRAATTGLARALPSASAATSASRATTGTATVVATAQGATTGVHTTSATAVARASVSSVTGNAAGEIHVTSGTASAGARATASTSSTHTGTGVARARASALASTVTSRATVASATVRAVAAGTVMSLRQTQGAAVAGSLASSETSSLRLTLGDAVAYATATSLTQQVGYIPPRITFDVVDATLSFDGASDATIHFDGASDALIMSDGEGVAILAPEQLATAVLLDVRDYAATLATDGESHATLDSDGVSSATLHTP